MCVICHHLWEFKRAIWGHYSRHNGCHGKNKSSTELWVTEIVHAHRPAHAHTAVPQPIGDGRSKEPTNHWLFGEVTFESRGLSSYQFWSSAQIVLNCVPVFLTADCLPSLLPTFTAYKRSLNWKNHQTIQLLVRMCSTAVPGHIPISLADLFVFEIFPWISGLLYRFDCGCIFSLFLRDCRTP